MTEQSNTASDLLVERQSDVMAQIPECILPHQDVQKFLLELIDQTSFQGKMAEFVSGVKSLIKNAAIKG